MNHNTVYEIAHEIYAICDDPWGFVEGKDTDPWDYDIPEQRLMYAFHKLQLIADDLIQEAISCMPVQEE